MMTNNPDVPVVSTSTVDVAPRAIDGLFVDRSLTNLAPRVLTIDNQVDARPWSGVSGASLVIESPVEGGITRLLAFFDQSATTTEIGPVRSARPYFVDWASGWNGVFFHVGGSPEALDKIKSLRPTFLDVDEMTQSRYFQRISSRVAPHSTYTDMTRLNQAMLDKGRSTSTIPTVWHFEDASTSTLARADQKTISIPYGGSYSVIWKYDATNNVYQRQVGGKVQRQRDGSDIEVSNVVVMKTDGRVLDEKGRLNIRTTGGGEAMIFRNGRKYIGRWQRSKDESIRFEGDDGTEFLLTRGKTWIEVTIDDQIFAGLGQ
jgi:hypothetical protein